MHKSPFFWATLGWLVSLVFPPQILIGMLKGVAGGKAK